VKYYNLQRHWTKKIEPHLGNPTLNKILVRDFNKFTFGLWRKPFLPGHFPREFENCDWWLGHRGKEPRFWQYVKHAACHWLVNFNLYLARLVEPNRSWRIITSDRHSTVWDGDQTLFEFNFLALGIDPDECFRLANEQHLEPGKERKVHMAQHYTAAA
jgi:hypothetical protein